MAQGGLVQLTFAMAHSWKMKRRSWHCGLQLDKAVVALFWLPLQETCLGTLSFMEAHRLVEMALGYVFVKVRCHMPWPMSPVLPAKQAH